MKRIYLVRHGQTKWNDEGRIQGWAYIDLDDVGRRQARLVADYLAQSHPGIDRIASSDLPRAVQTAETIASKQPFEDLSIELDDVWRERDFGVFQGFDSSTFFTDYPEYAILENGQAAAERSPEDGESYAAFDERVRSAWDEYVRSVSEAESCIVTHSGVIRQICAYVNDLDYQTAIADVSLENCSVTEIRVEDGDHSIENSNRRHFLENDQTESA
ncbi:histidine phosphatase family protein [Natrarchaeobius chitinivorans]|nr:histidine phosphatase family protein [Natrarchaeobius chitinivorans]